MLLALREDTFRSKNVPFSGCSFGSGSQAGPRGLHGLVVEQEQVPGHPDGAGGVGWGAHGVSAWGEFSLQKTTVRAGLWETGVGVARTFGVLNCWVHLTDSRRYR